MVAWWDRWQVPLYLGALGLGVFVGLVTPAPARGLAPAIDPALMALLYVTFLGVPFLEVRRACTDVRFLGALVAVNLLLVPLVVLVLTRVVAHDEALLLGALLVLLAPCVDYVIVFTRLAGGDAARLVAASPLLMALQMVLIPVAVPLIADRDAWAGIDPAPFVRALLLLVVVPLALAVLTQAAAGSSALRRGADAVTRAGEAAMVPLMMLVLGLVAASQTPAVAAELPRLVLLEPVYAAFFAVMVPLGALVGRLARLGTAPRRALALSGATRNSLVVLPLALAVPIPLVAAAVVTQTLVELLCMTIAVRAVPVLVRAR